MNYKNLFEYGETDIIRFREKISSIESEFKKCEIEKLKIVKAIQDGESFANFLNEKCKESTADIREDICKVIGVLKETLNEELEAKKKLLQIEQRNKILCQKKIDLIVFALKIVDIAARYVKADVTRLKPLNREFSRLRKMFKSDPSYDGDEEIQSMRSDFISVSKALGLPVSEEKQAIASRIQFCISVLNAAGRNANLTPKMFP